MDFSGKMALEVNPLEFSLMVCSISAAPIKHLNAIVHGRPWENGVFHFPEPGAVPRLFDFLRTHTTLTRIILSLRTEVRAQKRDTERHMEEKREKKMKGRKRVREKGGDNKYSSKRERDSVCGGEIMNLT